MHISDNGLQLIKAFEGCKLNAYTDQVGVITIGYGHTYNVQHDETCSQDQADLWLKSDLENVEKIIEKLVVPLLKQTQFDALCSFVFNLGANAFRNSTLLLKINRRDFAGAALEFPKWCHAGGKVDAGLVRRRAAEAVMFNQ